MKEMYGFTKSLNISNNYLGQWISYPYKIVVTVPSVFKKIKTGFQKFLIHTEDEIFEPVFFFTGVLKAGNMII